MYEIKSAIALDDILVPCVEKVEKTEKIGEKIMSQIKKYDMGNHYVVPVNPDYATVVPKAPRPAPQIQQINYAPVNSNPVPIPAPIPQQIPPQYLPQYAPAQVEYLADSGQFKRFLIGAGVATVGAIAAYLLVAGAGSGEIAALESENAMLRQRLAEANAELQGAYAACN